MKTLATSGTYGRLAAPAAAAQAQHRLRVSRSPARGGSSVAGRPQVRHQEVTVPSLWLKNLSWTSTARWRAPAASTPFPNPPPEALRASCGFSYMIVNRRRSIQATATWQHI